MSEEDRRLWGGRMSGRTDPEIEEFTSALPFDRRLVRFDLIGCLAHARMLLEQGALPQADAAVILGGLSLLLRQVEAGEREVGGDYEDVHSWIEHQLAEQIGEPARRLHTGRSRNDQTATALRLLVRDALGDAVAALVRLLERWLEVAREHTETWLPGYTHLQRAQPVSLAHHLLAHFWSLQADALRFERVHDLAGTSPLGAGALAGTPHPIRPQRTAELLGLPRVFENSMWAVADRDYVAETSFSCALLLVHLSRWAEEVVLWTSTEFGFATLADSVAKGSSLMPQKRNPEAAEILRGKTGRVLGDLLAHLVQLKGLPLTYNSDLQEDKEALFDALDTAGSALRAARALFSGLRYHPKAMAAALRGGFLTATDLADALARSGVPFRRAHEQAGRAVSAAERLGVELWELPDEELRRCCPSATEGVLATLTPEASARARTSHGGPAPERVQEQLRSAEAALEHHRRWHAGLTRAPIYRAHLEGTLAGELPGAEASTEGRPG